MEEMVSSVWSDQVPIRLDGLTEIDNWDGIRRQGLYQT